MVVVFAVGSLSSQNCLPNAIPFQHGEQIDYDVYYNMGKVWVPAGRVRFTVNDTIYNSKKCFFFDGKGKSLKNYDWFFKGRDRYSSIVEKEIANTKTLLQIEASHFDNLKIFFQCISLPGSSTLRDRQVRTCQRTPASMPPVPKN